jgi:hypothetical protein
MKSNILLLIICLISICSNLVAQVKYETGLLLGLQHTIAGRGPKYKTNVSEVKFLKPLSRSVGAYFDIKPNINRVFYGIEFMWDDNDFGYKAESHNITRSQGLSITSGVLTASDWINIYKGGIRIGYHLYRKKKIQLVSIIIPSLGYYITSPILADTTSNKYEREDDLEIQYIAYPTWQKQGLYFFLKGTVELQYKWSQHFSTSLMMSYQQGFTPFVIDTRNIIRPYEPSGPQEHEYWTKVNGTALQWHIGFKYIFRPR